MFPLDNFKSAINMALEKEGASIFEYDEGMGREDLRKELCTYLKSKKINRVLIVATGALFSPTNVFQHKNINSISHAVVLEALK